MAPDARSDDPEPAIGRATSLGDMVLDGDDVGPPPDGSTGADSPAGGRTRWIWLLIAVMTLLAAAPLWTLLRDDDRTPGDRSAVDDRDVARSVEQRWTTVIDARRAVLVRSGDVTVDAGTDSAGLALPVGLPGGGSEVLLLDRSDGRVRWATPVVIDGQPVDDVQVVTSSDDTVVVEVAGSPTRALVGLAVADGEVRWQLDGRRDGFYVRLAGTELVAEVSFDADAPFQERVDFIDPDDGIVVGGLEGVTLASSTDQDGGWFIRDEDVIRFVDLADGWTEPEVVASGIDRTITVFAVVGDRIVAIDGAGRLVDLAEDGSEIPIELGLGPIRDLAEVDDDHLVVYADAGITAGVAFGAGTSLVSWQRPGLLVRTEPTDRGAVALVTGAHLDINRSAVAVDAITGDDLAVLSSADPNDPLRGRATRSPVVLADGIVELIAGTELRASDLDGRELWRSTSPGAQHLVGDRMVVAISQVGDDVVVTASGEP